MGQSIILNGKIITVNDSATPVFNPPILINTDNTPIDFILTRPAIIPLQTTFNPSDMQTIYSWGNHAGLYKLIGYVPTWSEILLKPTFATVATSGSYNDLNSKPFIFDGTWNSLTGKPTTLSAFTNTPGYITGFTETDPTVPSWVKGISQLSITGWDSAVSLSHAHSNKTLLDSIALGDITNWNAKQPAGNYIIEGDARLTNSRVASDVYSWAKAVVKPIYTYSEISGLPTLNYLPLTGGTLSGLLSGTTANFLGAVTASGVLTVNAPANATSLDITGTTGSGFIKLIGQSSNPVSPVAGTLLLHSSTANGFTRMEQDNEAVTNLIYSRDNVFIAKNTSGAIISKGSVVYVTGSTGNVPNIAKAMANSMATLPSVGIVVDDMSINGFGQVMTMGIISNFNTSAFTIGSPVWVSTTVAGGLTSVRPSGITNSVQRVGSILVSSVGNGSLLINIAPAVLNMETGTNSPTWTGSTITGTLITATGGDSNTWNTVTNKVDTVVGKSLILDTEITRLSGIATGATNYTDAKALLAAPAETATTIKTALGITTLSGSNTGDQPANNWTIEAVTGDSILTQGGVIVQRVVNTGAVVNTLVEKTGNVGIGTINPDYPLCIISNTQRPFRIQNTNAFNYTEFVIDNDQRDPAGSSNPGGIVFGIGGSSTGGLAGVAYLVQRRALPFQFYIGGLQREQISGGGRHLFNTTTDDGVHQTQTNGLVKSNAYTTLIQPLTYAASVTLNYLLGANASTTLTGNIALVLSNVADGGSGSIYLTQDATGNRLLAGITHAGLTVKFKAADSTLTTTANAVDIIYYERIGTLLLITLTKNY